jgi:hypothetical protein
MAKRKYVAGWNQPGYLPESEPKEFDTFEDAREFIADELDYRLSQVLQDDTNYEGIIEHEKNLVLEETEPFSFLARDGYVYWVTRE